MSVKPMDAPVNPWARARRATAPYNSGARAVMRDRVGSLRTSIFRRFEIAFEFVEAVLNSSRYLISATKSLADDVNRVSSMGRGRREINSRIEPDRSSPHNDVS